eukprot:CAMPEP_0117576684 /NCGR_PEP_ID=MMETSP0784-20121206/62949_1 /TAXON_ID=39447 /ORGANISM="" /LENGTH=35 /DNA_ID= /DNA_START= /DNA_END= /DNA_ORIENTATION=
MPSLTFAIFAALAPSGNAAKAFSAITCACTSSSAS